MQFILFRFSLLMLVVFAAVPAVAIVVIDENFEDDVFVEDNFIVEDGEQVLVKHFTNADKSTVECGAAEESVSVQMYRGLW